jgi:hypothetical protein
VTVEVGHLVIQGLRFTAPGIEFRARHLLGFTQLWPSPTDIAWPSGAPLVDEDFHRVVGARAFESQDPGLELRPWRPATELPASRAVGEMVELPTMCGRHVVYYPAALVAEARRDRFYAFPCSCECPMAYLIHTEPDGAHCVDAGEPEGIEEKYERQEGTEVVIRGEGGDFVCKQLFSSPQRGPHRD